MHTDTVRLHSPSSRPSHLLNTWFKLAPDVFRPD